MKCENQYKECAATMVADVEQSSEEFVLYECPECGWVEIVWVEEEDGKEPWKGYASD